VTAPTCSGGEHEAPTTGGSCPCGLVTRVPASGDLHERAEAAEHTVARVRAFIREFPPEQVPTVTLAELAAMVGDQ
jgi:hypothetical protein